jgi:phospholipid/cholesterol/gamma-HCH transport system permease protein
MSMATAERRPTEWALLAGKLVDLLAAIGDSALFALQTLSWTVWRRPVAGSLLPVCFTIGVRSVWVVALTGMFIGMVLAVQMYMSLNRMGMETWIGSIVNMSVVRELGPVLAATMLAGRVGSAMAAELATMRVTEQIDALACLGVNPVHYLAVPRFVACVLLIPLLAILADVMGMMGAYALTVWGFGVEGHYYWQHSREFVGVLDVFNGLAKTFFFGAAIALISCHRGFRSRPGSAGVGQAATEAFVWSFIAILVLDFFLGLFLNTVQERLRESVYAFRALS